MNNITKDLIQNFAIGGASVAATSYLGTFMSPLAGAIFWSYPITILPTIFFMKQQKKTNGDIGKFLFSTTFALFLLMGITLLLSHLIKNSPKGESLWVPIGKSTIGFIVGGSLYFAIIKIFKLEKYFM